MKRVVLMSDVETGFALEEEASGFVLVDLNAADPNDEDEYLVDRFTSRSEAINGYESARREVFLDRIYGGHAARGTIGATDGEVDGDQERDQTEDDEGPH